MIVCPRCSKENQDHYKFCLGCGSELPRGQAEPKRFTAPTPPGGVDQVARPAGPVDCPNCGAQVPPNFKFCGSCGHDMAAAPPVAPAPVAEPAAPVVEPEPVVPAPVASPVAEPAFAPAGPVSEAPAGTASGSLVLIRPDGSEGDTFALGPSTIVGREAQGPFASDSYLSPQHASFSVNPGTATVKDLDSLNGVYVRIDPEEPTPLSDGDVFRIGQEILRFERYPDVGPDADGTERMGSPNAGYCGRVLLVIGRDTYGNGYPVASEGLHLGRERGDVIFPEDGYVSGLHCRLHEEGGQVYLTDVGSSNGTFVRVRGKQEVTNGSLLLLGQQLFRLEC